MPEQELLGVDQHPAQVLDGLAAVLGGVEVLDGRVQLGGVGLAGEGDQVELAVISSGDLPLLASRAIRPLSSRSLPLTVAPPMS